MRKPHRNTSRTTLWCVVLVVLMLGSALLSPATSRSAQALQPASTDIVPCPPTDPFFHPYVRPLEGHSAPVCSLAFHPEGHCLAGGSVDGIITLWDPRTTDATPIRTLEAFDHPVLYLGFSADGDRLVSCSTDGSAMLWDTTSYEPAMSLTASDARPVTADLRSDAQQMVMASADGQLSIWNLRTGAPFDVPFRIALPAGVEVRVIRYDPLNTDHIWLGLNDGTIERWSLLSERRLDQLEAHTDAVSTLVLSPSPDHALHSRWMLSGSNDENVFLWDPSDTDAIACQWRFGSPVSAVALAPSPGCPVVGLADGTLMRLLIEPCRLLTGIARIGSAIAAIAVHPCGQAIAASTVEGIVTLIALDAIAD